MVISFKQQKLTLILFKKVRLEHRTVNHQI